MLWNLLFRNLSTYRMENKPPMESFFGFKEVSCDLEEQNSSYSLRLVPWLNWDEWVFVRDSLFSNSPDSIASAQKRVRKIIKTFLCLSPIIWIDWLTFLWITEVAKSLCFVDVNFLWQYDSWLSDISMAKSRMFADSDWSYCFNHWNPTKGSIL